MGLVKKLFAVAFLVLVMAVTGCGWKRSRVSLRSVSLDGTYELRLVELRSFDRNFEIHLRELKNAKNDRLLFVSADEGPPGTERVVWLADNQQFLLVGRNFFLARDLKLNTGDSVYMLYDIPSQSIWLNARQGAYLNGKPTNFPSLTRELIEGFRFVGSGDE